MAAIATCRVAALEVDHDLLVALEVRRDRERLRMLGDQEALPVVERTAHDHGLVVLLTGDQPPAPVPPVPPTTVLLTDAVQRERVVS